MVIEVMSEAEVKVYSRDIPHILISIRSPKRDPIELPHSLTRVGTLFQVFHDVDWVEAPKIKKTKDCQYCEGTGYLPQWSHIEDGKCFQCNGGGIDMKLFSKKDAEEILLFVEALKNNMKHIIVNCEAGISRSAGIAAALSKIYNGYDEYVFQRYIPNRLVYRTILEEAQKCGLL